MSGPLPGRIAALAASAVLPDSREISVVRDADVRSLASELGMHASRVEAAALEQGIFPLRYIRNHELFSAADQLRLLRSSAAMVGLGGLGGHLIEALARLGVGRIRAADGDVFEEHNLNRQLLAELATVGLSKTIAARERVARINPAVRLATVNQMLEERDMAHFVRGADVAVDALGGLTHRLALQHAASDAGVPLVTGAMAGWSGWVAVVEPGGPGPAEFMGTAGAAEDELGTPAPTVMHVASLMAAQAAELLRGRKPSLAGRMLLVDMVRMNYEVVSLA